MVTLHEITEDNRAAVMELRVSADQEDYIETAAASLQEAADTPEARPWYRAVYAGTTPVGFVMLSENVPPGDERYPWRYFLWRLLIDERFQGRGFGRATLDALVVWLRTRPSADALFTSAGPGPQSPVTFYEHYGFVRTGQVFDDEIVLKLDLRASAAESD